MTNRDIRTVEGFAPHNAGPARHFELGGYGAGPVVARGEYGLMFKGSGPNGPVALHLPYIPLQSDQQFQRRWAAALEQPPLTIPGQPRALAHSTQGVLWSATEWIDGWPLSSLLQRTRRGDEPLTKREVLSVCFEIAQYLDGLHASAGDRVHGRLTTQRILLRWDGQIMVTGHPAPLGYIDRSHERRAREIAGMAPEQLQGGVLTPRTDVYLLARMAAELFTGRRPLDRATAGLTEQAVLRGVRPSDLQGLSPELEDWLRRCMSVEPNRRPAGLLAPAWRAFCDEVGGPCSPEHWVARVSRTLGTPSPTLAPVRPDAEPVIDPRAQLRADDAEVEDPCDEETFVLPPPVRATSPRRNQWLALLVLGWMALLLVLAWVGIMDLRAPAADASWIGVPFW